jgi:hypothetical protein
MILLLRYGSSANVDPATRFATVACDAVRSDTVGRLCRCDSEQAVEWERLRRYEPGLRLAARVGAANLGKGGGNKVLPHEAAAEHARQ